MIEIKSLKTNKNKIKNAISSKHKTTFKRETANTVKNKRPKRKPKLSKKSVKILKKLGYKVIE